MSKTPMKLIIIAASSDNNVIGKQGTIPWHIPGDMKRLREMTMGYPIIMGRATFESILKAVGGPLSGRRNIVVTRDKTFRYEGKSTIGSSETDVVVVYSLDEAIVACDNAAKAFIFGGGDIYRQSMDRADMIELTRVHQTIEGGDAFFPEIKSEQWKEVHNEPHDGYTYLTYERCK